MTTTQSPRADAPVIELPVGGMTCQGCVANITRGLTKLEGATEVNVNLVTKRATVRPDGTVDPAALEEAMKATITGLGYEVLGAPEPVPDADGGEDARRAPRDEPRRRARRPHAGGRLARRGLPAPLHPGRDPDRASPPCVDDPCAPVRLGSRPGVGVARVCARDPGGGLVRVAVPPLHGQAGPPRRRQHGHPRDHRHRRGVDLVHRRARRRGARRGRLRVRPRVLRDRRRHRHPDPARQVDRGPFHLARGRRDPRAVEDPDQRRAPRGRDRDPARPARRRAALRHAPRRDHRDRRRGGRGLGRRRRLARDGRVRPGARGR